MEPQHILITGASSGIGREILELFANRHDNIKILAVARHPEKIPTYEGKVFPFSADLSESSGIDSLINLIRQEWKYIDLCLANAGFGYCEPVSANTSWEHIHQIFDTNLLGQIYLLGQLVDINREAQCHPLHFASTISAVAKVPLPYYALYSSSKAGLDMFLDTYRYEKPSWVSLSSIYPIATRTQFFTKASGQANPPLPMFRQQVDSAALSIYKGLLKHRKRIYPYQPFGWFYPWMRAFPFLIQLYSCNEKRKMERFFANNATE